MTYLFGLRFLRRAALCAVLASAIFPIQLVAEDLYEPRPISDAEQAAVEAVLAFLETGPNALYTRLSEDSPLRLLSPNQAVDEIAVRMGLPEGSRWQLQTPGRAFESRFDIAIFTVEFPSGVDDILSFNMVEESGTWLIHQIRCTADPRRAMKSTEEELQQLFDSDAAAPLVSPRGSSGRTPGAELFVVLLAFASFVVWSFGSRRGGNALTTSRPTVRVAMVLGLSTAILTGGCQFFQSSDEEEPEEIIVQPDALELASLLPLRRAFTGGRDRGAEGPELEMLDSSDLVSVTAHAWQAQILMLDGKFADAAEILNEIPEPDEVPLVAILRARFAAARAEAEAASLYESARKLGPDHDGLAHEAALGAGMVGEEGKMENHMRAQMWMKARTASAFYYVSQFELTLDKRGRAEKAFRAGWNREPVNRFELLRQPLLANVAIRPTLLPLLELSKANEPAVGPRKAATRPLALPEGATSRILGENLVIELRDRVLGIPGGGDLVPEGTVVESAAERTDREVEAALGQFDVLAKSLSENGTLRPSHRRAVDTLLVSLTYRKEWQKLLDLTTPLASDPAKAPPSLMQARALALMETGQTVPATQLIIELAQSDQANLRRDFGTYYQLGEMLTELGQYDLALRAMDRAASLGLTFAKQRQQQIELMKELEEAKKVYESWNFRLVYPAGAGETYAKQLSWVLEAELERIKKWIPIPAKSPKIEVHLYPWRKFTTAYAQAGGLVAGLYDGVVRVPLADYESFHPDLLQIYSHEVAHAMIDIATGDRAPSWFHEGLAGHIEMHQRQVNPMPDMHEAGHDLTFTLLEPTLAGWADPQLVELAYANAAWALHYVETRHGIRGIHKMLDAYRRGNDTEGALRRALGVSVESFDEGFRRWALNDAPAIWSTEVVDYHKNFDSLVVRDSLNPTVQSKPADNSRLLKSRGDVSDHTEFDQRVVEWHKNSYLPMVRDVKVSLAKALPLIQGKAKGDVDAACFELGQKLEILLRDRKALNSPDYEVTTFLRSAYKNFNEMTDKCRRREWKAMQQEMRVAIHNLGKAEESMRPYDILP